MCNVNVATGEVVYDESESSFPGAIPFSLGRVYRSFSSDEGVLGPNWSFTYDAHIEIKNGTAIYHHAGISEPLDLTGAKSSVDLLGAGVSAERVRGGMLVTDADRLARYFVYFPPTSDLLVLVQITDANQNRIDFEIDTAGRHTRITDTEGRQFDFNYSHGRLTEISFQSPVDRSRHLLRRFTYDWSGNLVECIDAAGNAMRYEYSDRLLVRVVNRLGGEIYYQYDAGRRCVRTWRQGGKLDRALKFDSVRRATLVTDSLGYSTLYEYDEQFKITGITDPYGRQQQFFYSPDGALALSVRPNGEVNGEVLEKLPGPDRRFVARGSESYEFAMDDRNNIVSMKDPVGSVWSWRYDERNNTIAEISPTGLTWRYEYDDRGHLVVAVAPGGRRFTLVYNELGQHVSTSDDVGLLEQFEYGSTGKIVLFRNPRGESYRHIYDELDHLAQIVMPDGSVRRFLCDAEGNLLQETDELGNSFAYTYDSFGLIIGHRDPFGNVFRLIHDTEDRLIRLINEKGEVFSITYDATGNPLVIESFDGSQETYEYNANGLHVVIYDAEGRRTKRSIDAGGRPVMIESADGSQAKYEYDPLGRILKADNGVKIAFAYDEDGRPSQETQAGNTIEYSYNASGLLESTVINKLYAIRYLYNARWLPRSIECGDLATVIEYDAGNWIQVLRGRHGAVQRFDYDSRSRLISHAVTVNNHSTLNRSYRYNPASLQIGRADEIYGSYEYAYDPREQLVEVRRADSIVEWYRYDECGNIVQTQRGSGEAGTGNRLAALAPYAYTYDANGNLIRRAEAGGPELTLVYDAQNHLNHVVSDGQVIAEYVYDPLGRRVRKKTESGETVFLWSDQTLIAESVGGSLQLFVQYPGRSLPLMVVGGRRSAYFCPNHAGTPFGAIEPNLETHWREEPTSFGLSADPEEYERFPLRFPGQYADRESGLFYNRFRYYDPAAGRFTSPDPIGLLSGEPNFYRYGPNPLTYFDPLGLVTAQTLTLRCQPWMSRSEKEWVKDKKDELQKKAKQGKLVYTPCPARRSHLDDYYEKHCKPSLQGGARQPDHIHDLALGGPDFDPANKGSDCGLFKAMPAAVNGSLGAQCGNQYRGWSAGDVVTSVIAKNC